MTLLHNLRYKLASLGLAVLCWMLVVISTSQLRTFPLEGGLTPEVFNLPKDLVVVSELPAVQLKIDAEQSVLENLSENSFAVFVDLKGRSAGEHNVKVSATTENPAVKIQRIEPSTINLVLDEIAEETVPVHVELVGEVSPNFAPESPILEFNTVQISGAASLIAQAAEAVATVALNGESSNILKTWPLEIRDNSGQTLSGLVAEPARVAVTVPLKEVTSSKTVDVKVKLSGTEKNKNYAVSNITTDPLFLEIQGKAETLQNIDFIETKAIDVSNLNRNSTQTVTWDLPEGVSLAHTAPTVAIVLLEVTPQVGTREFTVPLTLKNTPDHLSVLPREATVTLSGQIIKLDALRPDSIRAEIDLSTLTSDQNTFALDARHFALPEGVSLLKFEPAALDLQWTF